MLAFALLLVVGGFTSAASHPVRPAVRPHSDGACPAPVPEATRPGALCDPFLDGLVAVPGLSSRLEVDGALGVVAHFTGLTIFDLSDPSQPVVTGRLIDESGWEAIDLQSPLLFAARGGALEIWDLSTPGQPRRLGGAWGDPASFALDVDVAGDFALLSSTEGVALFDVADPSSPAFVRNVLPQRADGTEVLRLSARGPLLTLVSGSGSLETYDLSDPEKAVPLGKLSLGGGLESGDLVVRGTRAWVTSPRGFSVVDLSAPATPVVLHREIRSATPTGLAVDRGLLAILDADEDATAELMDVAASAVPLSLGRLPKDTAVLEYYLGPGYLDARFAGDHLLVAAGGSGLRSIAIGDCRPAALPPPEPAFEVRFSARAGENRALIADRSNGFPSSWSWDFGDGTTSLEQDPEHAFPAPGTWRVSLTVANSAGSASTSRDVVVVAANTPSPRFAWTPFAPSPGQPVTFAAEHSGGGHSWDFGDPDSGAANTSTLAQPSHTFAAAGTYRVRLEIADGSSVPPRQTRLVEVPDPTACPTPLLGRDLSPTYTTAVAADGDSLLRGDSWEALLVLGDFSEPAHPTWTIASDRYSFGDGEGVALSGDLLVWRSESSTYLVAQRVDRSVEVLSSIDLDTSRIRLDGPWLFAAKGRDLKIFDLSVPRFPRPAATWNAASSITSLATRGARLFLGRADGRLDVVDISDRTSPVLLGSSQPVDAPLTELLAEEGVVWARIGSELQLATFDLSSPSTPVLADIQYLDEFDGANPSLAVAGDVLYVTVERTVELFDVSNRLAPRRFGSQWLFSDLDSWALSTGTGRAFVEADFGTALLYGPASCGGAPLPPSVDFTWGPERMEPGTRAQFQPIRSGGTPTRWRWDFGGGATSDREFPWHGWSESGTHRVRLTVWNDAGSATAEHDVVVSPVSIPPVAVASARPTPAFTGAPVRFQGGSSAGPAETFHWDFGDGTTATIGDPTHAFASAGLHRVTLTVGNAAGSSTAIAEVPVEAHLLARSRITSDFPLLGAEELRSSGSLVLARQRDRIRVIDASDMLATKPVGVIASTLNGVTWSDADIFDDVAYALDGWNRNVELWDLSVPANPSKIGSLPSTGVTAIAVGGDLLLVRRGESEVASFLLSDPRAPIPSGSITGCPGSLFAASGRRAVCASDRSISVVDFEDPSTPELVGPFAFETGIVESVDLAGHLVVAAVARSSSPGSEIALLSFPDSAPPSQIGSVPLASRNDVGAVKLLSEKRLARRSSTKLEILDVSDPLAPLRLVQEELPNGYDLALIGDWLFANELGHSIWPVAEWTEPADRSLVLPGAARADGQGGSRWRSDLIVTNPSPEPASLSLSYRPFPGFPATATTSTFVAPPHGTLLLEDLLGTAFGLSSGAGVVAIETASPSGVTPLVWMRTYNDSDSGTFGQEIPALSASHASSRESVRLLPGLAADSDFRSNLGIVNLDTSQLEVEVSLTTDSGLPLGEPFLVRLDGLGATQLSGLPQRAGFDGPVAAFRARVRRWSGGAFSCYGSRIDNRSGDPVFVPGDLLGRLVGSLPGIARSPGAGGTDWRSRLIAANTTDRPATLGAVLTKPDGSRTSGQLGPVAVGGEIDLPDLLESLGVASPASGTLEIAGLCPPYAVTYNDDPDGTFGQTILPVRVVSRSLYGPPLEPQWIAGVRGGGPFRTNLGLVAVGGAIDGRNVRLTLFDHLGAEVASTVADLGDDSSRQAPLAQWIAVPGDFALGSLRIEALDTAHVFAYASIVDNGTGDPSFVPGRTTAESPFLFAQPSPVGRGSMDEPSKNRCEPDREPEREPNRRAR